MKVLFVGFGSIAGKHYTALKKLLPDCEVYSLRSSDKPLPFEGIINLFNWDEVPGEIDFAIISNPTHQHRETLEKLVEKNIPVFIEKPLSHTLEGLETVCEKVKQKGLVTYVSCNLRFLPVFHFLKEHLLPGKTINEVSVYCGSFLPSWRPGKNFRELYSARKEMGGGVHLDLFHEIDYTCWLFGIPDKSYRLLRSTSSLNISSADFASYQFLYPKFTALLTLNYYRVDPKRTIEIVFEDETVLVDLLSNSVTKHNGDIIFSGEDTIADTYDYQMKYFLDLLAGKTPAMNDIAESTAILKICLTGELS